MFYNKDPKLKAVYGKNQAQYTSDIANVQACGQTDLLIVYIFYPGATIVHIFCPQQTATICWN